MQLHSPWGLVQRAVLEDDGRTLITDVRFDRVFLINGLFYGIEGMCVGGTRRLKISPSLDMGVPGVIPPNAALKAEATILEERNSST
jgi:FKBP-type peptidyl-prolyl cis-trans isomerase